MATLTRGENKIQLTILLSMLIIPFGFYVYAMSGLLSMWSLIAWGFGLLTYISILANLQMKLPEKHRKAVEGKNFLDMRIHRNKEESTDYFFGVSNHQPLQATEFDVQAVTKDPHYQEIQMALYVDSERLLITEELKTRQPIDDFEQVSNLSMDDESLEWEPGESHDRLQQMQAVVLTELKAKIDERYNDVLKLVNEHKIQLRDLKQEL